MAQDEGAFLKNSLDTTRKERVTQLKREHAKISGGGGFFALRRSKWGKHFRTCPKVYRYEELNLHAMISLH
jgi:hypothetical protein